MMLGLALWISMSSLRFSMPKLVKAVVPSSLMSKTRCVSRQLPLELRNDSPISGVAVLAAKDAIPRLERSVPRRSLRRRACARLRGGVLPTGDGLLARRDRDPHPHVLL